MATRWRHEGVGVLAEKHLKAALAVWDYNAASCRRLFGQPAATTGPAVVPLWSVLLQEIQANPSQGVSKTEMHLATGNRRPAEEVNAALAYLLASSLAYPKATPTGGRPAERWFPGATTTPLPQDDEGRPAALRANEESSPGQPAPASGDLRANEER